MGASTPKPMFCSSEKEEPAYKQEYRCCAPGPGATSHTEALRALHLQGQRERAVCAPSPPPFGEAILVGTRVPLRLNWRF